MAEPTQADQVRAGMERWLRYVQESHIDEWAADRKRLMQETQGAWQGVVDDPVHGDDLRESVALMQGLTQDLTQTNDSRDGMDVAIPPEDHLNAYRWEAERQADFAPFDLTEAEERAYEDAVYDRREDVAHEDRDYDTQYTGLMGSAPPDRIEIDTSDHDMGGRWTEQLAALEARLDALTRETQAQEQTMGMEW
jgi:hypothetical protein